MLRMPTLIRQWKTVSTSLVKCTIKRHTDYYLADRQVQLDQVAEINAAPSSLQCFCNGRIMYSYLVSKEMNISPRQSMISTSSQAIFLAFVFMIILRSTVREHHVMTNLEPTTAINNQTCIHKYFSN